MRNHVEIARESVAVYGVENTDLGSLLSIMLGKTVPSTTIGALASMGVVQLARTPERELMEYEGMTKNKCLILKTAFGIANKFQQYSKGDLYIIRTPEDAAHYLMDEMRFLTQEHFVAIYLDTKNQVIRRKTLFIGSLNASIVHPREVMKEAVACSAASIIVAHNHPSGNPDPSREDTEVTKRLAECGKIMGIDLMDHIIIGDRKFVSLKEKGYL